MSRLPPLEDSPLQSDWPTQAAGPPPRKRHPLSFFKELPVLIILAFGLALLIKTFLVQAFYIPSGSMEPTLHGCVNCSDADRVLVNKLAYRFREPRRGEIIVFIAEHGEQPKSFLGKVRSFLTEGLGVSTPSEKDFIKRVIGLPGETLEMKDGIVRITTVAKKKITLKEPYILQKDLNPFGPTKVPKDAFFVMGDNRTNSQDSRVRGPIKRSDVIGKAFVRIWPFKRIGRLGVPSYAAERALGVVETAPWAAGGLVALAGTRRRRRAA